MLFVIWTFIPLASIKFLISSLWVDFQDKGRWTLNYFTRPDNSNSMKTQTVFRFPSEFELLGLYNCSYFFFISTKAVELLCSCCPFSLIISTIWETVLILALYLPKLVNGSWLWRIIRGILANQKQTSTLNE